MDVAPLHTAPQAVAPGPVSTSAEQPAENRQLIQAVLAVNVAGLFGQDSELTFARDRRTQRTVIRLVDRRTREGIREVPAEEVLGLVESVTGEAEDTFLPLK
jgi:uncharacterized FlaG/YvyC family protein